MITCNAINIILLIHQHLRINLNNNNAPHPGDLAIRSPPSRRAPAAPPPGAGRAVSQRPGQQAATADSQDRTDERDFSFLCGSMQKISFLLFVVIFIAKTGIFFVLDTGNNIFCTITQCFSRRLMPRGNCKCSCRDFHGSRRWGSKDVKIRTCIVLPFSS